MSFGGEHYDSIVRRRERERVVDKDKGNRLPPLRSSPRHRKSSIPSVRCAPFSGYGNE
jgi:hypothetical protein